MTPTTTRIRAGATREGCNHHQCAGYVSCRMVPDTLTPFRVDFCAPGCFHCKGAAS